MFDDLRNYSKSDHFFFSNDDPLGDVCNAPKSGSGIYLVYALSHGRIELLYIGSSGKMQRNGKFKHRKGGLYDRIVNGKQFDDTRKTSWPRIMSTEQIEALDVYWYETYNNLVQDIPAYTEGILIQRHYEINGKLPRWNTEF